MTSYKPVFFGSLFSCVMASATAQPLPALQETNAILMQADLDAPDPRVSPARRINRRPPGQNLPPPAPVYRSIDGSGNNPEVPRTGASHTQLLRLLPADYGDGVETLAGAQRASARIISNIVNAQETLLPNALNASDYVWQWGQFLDHDIDLTDGVEPPEPEPIAIPAGDSFFDPTGTGTAQIAFNRSLYDPDTGTDPANPRQQLNEISAWIDASNVYGSDSERASALRSNDGSGRLLTSAGNLLPFNTAGLANAGGDSDQLFIAGDVRANEQVGLTVMHTLFVREHNRLANQIRNQSPNLSGDEIYERARRIVGAQMQVITYREYLPILLGQDALPSYQDYQPEIDGTITSIFSTAAYRYGHSALSPTLLRLDARGVEINAGHLPLRNAFFSPHRLTDEGGIEPLLRGLAAQVCQTIDPYVIDDVRNFLFGAPGAGGFDLAALNIQRGRDHGLPSYNTVREAFGFTRATQFSDISSDPGIQARLAAAYASVDDIDLWIGGLAEDRVPGAMVGSLVKAVLSEQFAALRDGDRFWYQRLFSGQELQALEATRLADIIRRNTLIGAEIADNVFRVSAPEPLPGPGGPGGPRPPRP